MTAIGPDFEGYLATTATMLDATGASDAVKILHSATVRIEETGFDNWNGGTTIWTVYLAIDPVAYAKLGGKRKNLEEQIAASLKEVINQYTADWYGVSIVPRVMSVTELPETVGDVSQEVRRNIIDGLKIDEVAWNGRLNDVEFLQRIFDLEALQSTDSRYKDAARDIWQHRINNPDDWPDDWVYGDKRLKLVSGPKEVFLKFLCEMVHPVVRPDRNESLQLVQNFNDQLRRDGWQLVEEEKIAGRPRFVPEYMQTAGARSVSRARAVADALNAAWMQNEIKRLENAVERDPSLAIGTAKELVETCCKSILTKLEVSFSKSADLPELTKLVAKELKLVPEGISEEAKGSEAIRLILRNLAALTQYLAELRGLYGSGHGRDGGHRGLEPRHARLAVGAAVAFIDFVTETYHRRIEQKPATSSD